MVFTLSKNLYQLKVSSDICKNASDYCLATQLQQLLSNIIITFVADFNQPLFTLVLPFKLLTLLSYFLDSLISTMAQYLEQYRQSLEKMLYEPGKLNDWLTLAENKAGVKRIYIALGMISLCFSSSVSSIIFFLIISSRSHCCFICLLGVWLWGSIALQCHWIRLSCLCFCQGY